MRWLALLSLIVLVCACTRDEPIKEPFVDSFDRAELGSNYFNTGAPYQIVNGQLNIRGAFNHPLWLKKMLPRDAVIEFDVTSRTPDGDIKVEAWGDGQSYATTKGAYLATSYVFIFGGWGNRLSALVRLDEHAADRKTRADIKVQPNKTYRFRIERRGKSVKWLIDGKPFLDLDDPAPLEGNHHAHFGFNNWQSDLYFDNLKITPLTSSH